MLEHTKKLVSITISLILISLLSLSIPYIANASTVPIIVIDPGHGGRQTGAIGPNGLREKTVNLRVALRLKDYLKAAGARVVLTRTSDRILSLAARVSIAKRVRATRFVSIHHNSSINRRVNGTETYARRGADYRSRDMASKIQRSLLKYLGHSNRGVRRARFYVLRKMKIPAVLTEASFISNRSEARRLRSSSYIDREARAIFFGLKAHMNFKPSYSPVAIQGTAAPAQEIFYPHVIDTGGFWRNLVSVKNTATVSKDITISFYADSGTLMQSKNLTLGSEQTYNFYPRKILGGNFGGSIKISTSSADLVGKLTQVSKSGKAIASVQGLAPSNEVYVPNLVDTTRWHSFVALVNTSGGPAQVTIDYYNASGSLVQSKTVTINSQAKYYFRPMNSIGSVFNGSAKITSAAPIIAYVSRVNTGRTRLGVAPAVQKADSVYFAKAPDNATWLSYLSLQNTSSSSKQITIYAYRSDGSLRRQQTVNIAAKAKYENRVANLAGANFNGALKIVSQDSSLVAYLTESNRRASALGIIEGQQGLQGLYYPNVTDSTNWNSEFAASNVGSSTTANISLLSYEGNQLTSKTQAVNANGSFSFFPFELVNQGFNGSINISASANQLVGYLAHYR